MKRSPIKKRGKKAVSTRKLDALFWAKIKERDGARCVKCGKGPDGLAPSHVYPKGKYPRLRWELDNAWAGCFHCHIVWWHRHPLAAAEWFNETFPQRAANLRLLARFAAKVDRAEVLKQLEEE